MTPPPNDPAQLDEPSTGAVPAFQPRPFQPSPPLEEPNPTTPPQPTTPEPSSEWAPQEDAGELGPEPSSVGPTPADTKRANLLNGGIRAAYAKTVKTVAMAASGLVEARAGAGTGALLMADDEAADIAAPASRILARHAPMPGGAGPATDLADAVELVVALAGYAMNALARRAYAITGGAPIQPAPLDDTAGNNPPQIDPYPPALPPWPGANMAPDLIR